MTRALAACGLVPPGSAPGQDARVLGDASRTLEAFGCDHVVLDAAVSQRLLAAWSPAFAAGRPRVAAVHAPCPLPEAFLREGVSFTARDVRLAAPDRGDRAEALALVRSAFDTANFVEADTVVLEGGQLVAVEATASLATMVALDAPGGAALADVRGEISQSRARAAAAAVDGLSFAVEALLRLAEERGVTVALAEQRGPEWVGSRGELAVVLERFAGGPVAWWADPIGCLRAHRALPHLAAAIAGDGPACGDPMDGICRRGRGDGCGLAPSCACARRW